MEDANAEWRRLQGLYAGMGDEQLLDLARKKAELTEVAQQVLSAELRARKLEVPVLVQEERVVEPVAADDPSIMLALRLSEATEIEVAKRSLDEAGVLYRTDPSKKLDGWKAPPEGSLDFFIGRQDQGRVREALRSKLDGFFEDDEDFAPETVEVGGDMYYVLGTFESMEKAQILIDLLKQAEITYTVSSGVDDGGDYWSVAAPLEEWGAASEIVESHMAALAPEGWLAARETP